MNCRLAITSEVTSKIKKKQPSSPVLTLIATLIIVLIKNLIIRVIYNFYFNFAGPELLCHSNKTCFYIFARGGWPSGLERKRVDGAREFESR